MSLLDIVTLFLIMVPLAAIPGASAILVSARSATSGFTHGLYSTLGIVTGDIIFILLVVSGLSTLAETMGSLFFIIKLLGGAYLIWLGIGLLRSSTPSNSSSTLPNQSNAAFSPGSSFLAGLLITLGDIKAIFFYLSLLPGFVDIAKITIQDVIIIVAITIIAVGGTKLIYAFSASKTRLFSKTKKIETGTKVLTGSLMITTGGVLISRT